ncbi:MAG: transposase [Pseudonocardia sp.]|nr:transposase [Pseudonocardia sp.]
MVDLAGWVASLDAVVELISGRLARSEPRQRVGSYLRGLLAGLERRNLWTLAEHSGAASPDGMQRPLRTADWDVEGVRDDLGGYVLEQLGDEASGVFIVDETGFIKKGVRSAGVQRQYTGTIGKIDNCQLGVSGSPPNPNSGSRCSRAPSPLLAGLVRARHSGHARRRLPRRHSRPRGRKGGSAVRGDGPIPLSGNEIRGLLAALVLTPVACVTTVITWSHWRRRRQHQARACHHRHRGQRPPP